MADEPKPPHRSELYARAEKEFEAQLDEYMEEWETSLQKALTTRPIKDAAKPRPRQYPERKQRDLTDDEKAQLRARIERGDADIYALAREFGCSASQVAGIKAAMHR
ncbi:MAG TPA: hypothetical protein VJ739_16215 [Gemmataceae bacterium]|nr:hypothetical protein [Gemmataceae bacterium]